jgi:dTDP-4-dehydrorhamnose reductase
VVADQRGAPTRAEDLAEVILNLLGAGEEGGLPATAAPYGVYHVTNEGHCSWFEFAGEVVRRGGWDRRVEPIDSQALGRPARRPAYSVLSLASINSRGLRTRPWQAALAGFLAELQRTDPQLFPAGQRSGRPRSGRLILSPRSGRAE